MLCRNRVVDFARRRAVFSSHAAAHRDAGLRLPHIWRSADEPNNVLFRFEVAGMESARDFIGNPKAAKAAQSSGVIDGEYHCMEDAGGY